MIEFSEDAENLFIMTQLEAKYIIYTINLKSVKKLDSQIKD